MAGARNGKQQGLGSQPHRRTTGSRLVSNLFSWEAVEKLMFIRDMCQYLHHKVSVVVVPVVVSYKKPQIFISFSCLVLC